MTPTRRRSIGARSRSSRGAPGGSPPDVANLLNNLAALQQTRGQYDQAEALSRRSLAIIEDILGNEATLAEVDEETALALRRIHQQALAHLATALRSQGRYADAEGLYQRAIDIAVPYRSLGRHGEAGQYFGRALPILEATCGTEHPNTIACRVSFGALLRELGREAEADQIEGRASKSPSTG
jgi:tetratricopeptide (TPR) repeat protein